jgi:hypothetical protein
VINTMVLKSRTNGKQDVGLALLGISSSFGIWSALNTSPVGTVQFASSNPAIAYKGMNWGLGIILVTAAGIALYYKKRGYAAAATTAATGIGMWLWYDRLIQENLPSTVTGVTQT